jgi:hypothetical protein
MYGFHFIGVTVCSVPLLELTQPAAVRRHGYGSRYRLPRPSRTNSVTSSPTGAVVSVRTHNHEQIRELARSFVRLWLRQLGKLFRNSPRFVRCEDVVRWVHRVRRVP